jgi:hypothetical protein
MVCGRGWGAGFDKADADGEPGQVQAVVQVEFVHDVGPVPDTVSR